MNKKGVFVICLFILLSGCGQSGPLYLPDRNPPVSQDGTSS